MHDTRQRPHSLVTTFSTHLQLVHISTDNSRHCELHSNSNGDHRLSLSKQTHHQNYSSLHMQYKHWHLKQSDRLQLRLTLKCTSPKHSTLRNEPTRRRNTQGAHCSEHLLSDGN